MTNFERTLRLIQDNLTDRLRPEYHRVWVQGCNRPSMVTLLFTFFNRDGYQMRFLNVRNFRQFRQESENVAEEMAFISRHIESFQVTIEDFVTY